MKPSRLGGSNRLLLLDFRPRVSAGTAERSGVKLADQRRQVIWNGHLQSRPKGSVEDRLEAPEDLSDRNGIETKIGPNGGIRNPMCRVRGFLMWSRHDPS